MPAASVLAPSALLAVAAALGWVLERLGVSASRWLAVAGAWLAMAVLLATWGATGRSTLELNLPGTLGGAPLALRLDAIGVGFGLVVLLPTALLFTFQRRNSAEASVAALAASASLLASEAGSLLLTALALGTCSSLVLVALRLEDDRPTNAYLASLSMAGLLLLWAGAVLEVTGGTSVYSAAPVTALRVPVFLLLAGAGLLCSGLLPWPSWLPAMWNRDRLEAGSLAIALLNPIGFLLLARAYLLGAGHWPTPALNVALAAVGVAVAVAAAVRAQASSSRASFLGEAVALGGGMALLALSLGTSFGVSAAALTLAGSALIVGLAPLLPSGRWPSAILATAVIVGAPPALIFGGRLLAVQAAVEAGGIFGFLGLAAAASWLLAVAAVVRLPGLSGEGEDEHGGERLGAYAGLALAVLGGLAAGVLETLLGLPLGSEAIGAPAAAVSGGYLAVVTASGGWAAFTLGAPLLLLLVVAALLSRPAWSLWPARPRALSAPPPPLLRLPSLPPGGRRVWKSGGLRFPDQYRSILDPSTLESAVAVGRPWLWGAITLALIIVVTR